MKSLAGTQFRIWATQRLREYIVKGFALDDDRLKQGGSNYFDGFFWSPFMSARSYMKAIGVDDGLLLNFASMPLTIKRMGREQSTYQTHQDLGESGNQELRKTDDAGP